MEQTETDGYEAYAGRAHFAALDGLRFLSILGVLFHHSPLTRILGPSSDLFRRGYLGVDLFFVISGFLITSLLLRERDRKGRISLVGFYKRRTLRILPLYYLVVTVVGGYYVLVQRDAEAASYWPFYYLFLANFLTGDISMLSPTWSLSVEEQYYLVWPLLMLILPSRKLFWGALAAVGVYVVVVQAGYGFPIWSVGPLDLTIALASYSAILLGAALAIGLHSRAGFARLWPLLGHRWSSVVIGAILLAELALIRGELVGFNITLVHVTMAAFLGSLVIREDTPMMPAFRFAPIVRIGVISYGIYLLHHIARYVAVAVTERLGGVDNNLLIFMVLFWGGSVVLAEISFRYYEKPFLALRHKPLGFLPRALKSKDSGGKLSS